MKAVQEQVAQLVHVPNTLVRQSAGQLAQALVEKGGIADAQCFFCNSGAEANEAVIKIARLNGKPRPL
ncbi:MAG: aminotransferase class III-fold pyridoxal phosphate-dependent enzyme [Gemmataceae bacterium]